jgi:hypothetical protein
MAYILRVDGTEESIQGKLTLEMLKKVVGGYIETVPAKGKNQIIILNEDGIHKQLPVNEVATNLLHPKMAPWSFNVILGDVVVADRKELH